MLMRARCAPRHAAADADAADAIIDIDGHDAGTFADDDTDAYFR